MDGGELLGRHVHLSERVLRLLDLLLQPNLRVLDATAPLQIEDVVDTLQKHRDALESIGDFTGDGREVHSADLLEVRELRDLEAVEQHLPPDTPCTERR